MNIKELKKKIKELVPDTVVFNRKGMFTCSSFPDKLKPTVRDLIDCHFDIIESDWFSVKFVEKY